jgi:hypothetical protein
MYIMIFNRTYILFFMTYDNSTMKYFCDTRTAHEVLIVMHYVRHIVAFKMLIRMYFEFTKKLH